MNVLICGQRDYKNRKSVAKLVGSLEKGTLVIEGGAPGADTLAREEAHRSGLAVATYHAPWSAYGKRAGPIRNRWMLKHGRPNLVVAFYHDKSSSKGTRNMVEQARKNGVQILEIED